MPSATHAESSGHPGTEWLIDQVTRLILGRAIRNLLPLVECISAVREANRQGELSFDGPDGKRYSCLSLSNDDFVTASMCAVDAFGQ